MRHLLLKDFMLQKRILVLVCVYVIVLGFLFQGMTDGQIVLAMSIVGFILIIFSTAWESKSDVLWNSVPIPTWKIVGAKYLSIFVYLAGAL
ncbi:MAG TPA: ABC-2 transporter permease, partial [Firmicutes bacterium]|nr:ABC-2 transporter permease [Bacillota bacterium]